MHDGFHLMPLRMRYFFCGNLRLVQAFFSQRLLQSFQRLADRGLSIRLPEAKLHRSGRRRIGGRRHQSLDSHFIEEQVFSRDEIDPDTSGSGRHYRFQIRVIARSIERSQTLRNFLPVQRFPRIHRDPLGVFRKHLAIFPNNSYGRD
jgi:hypothetical protein